MVDFRKWLLALAIVGLLLGLSSSPANAQTPPPTFQCQATSGVPNILRAEGITELLGDLILNCTGGTPTTFGAPIPLQNVQISVNTNITSRIVATGNVSEALLLIDEPYPAPSAMTGPNPPTPFSQAPTAANAPAQRACLADNNTNCAITSVGPGIGAAGSYNGSAGHYNIFQGYQTAVNTMSWSGVPIDAPGTAGTRVVRITNIRANAFQLGVSSTLVPTQISMIVAVSGSTFISILQPSNGNVVGQVQPGLLQPPGIAVGSTKGAANYAQCTSVNAYLLPGGSGSPTDGGIVVSATEGFPASWKVQNYYQYFAVRNDDATDYIAPGNLTNFSLQNIPGFTYDTESGFFTEGVTGLTEPTGVNELVGLADAGTELQFTVNGVGAGVSLFAPSYVYLTGSYGAGTPQGVAVLVSQGAVSTGAFSTSTGIPVEDGGGTNGPNVQLTITGTSVTLVYEIYYADPNVQETLSVPISVAYISNTGSNIPATTTTPATVGVEFSPQSTVTTASSSAPIPRFGPSGTPSNFFSIAPCTCNLLFPFVANIAGFDTGVSIANTSLDIYGTSPQTGTITLNYFGTTTGGGAAPPKQTTNGPVPGGSELVFTLSNGGNYGIAATPGFEGYIIAQANFQYCHGFAEITDQGAQRLGSGYLAISLDIPALNRTLNLGENEGH